jgi:DNA-binding NtrC family response regulator
MALIDSALAGNDGFQLLERIKSLRPDAEIILTASMPDVDEAVEAIRRGAIDYMTHPVAVERLLACIEHLDGRSMRASADQSTRAARAHGAKTFISGNPEMLELLEAAKMVAGTKATILITGESGTGKEVLAAHIHRVADKADLPFVAVNCAALPDTLIESELFGHEKGAFTGATQRKMGKFEQVGEGTLVLDEIGDMPLALQPKILRVLQERRIERLGGAGDRPFNGQVVAITNQDLEAAVKDGRFREDLYYRINVVPLHLPPLRARPDDVPLLVQYFISQYASRYQKNLETPSPSILERMAAEEWRGNVRELENRIERAVLLSRGPQLDDELLRGNGPTIPTPDDAAVIQAGLSVKGMEKILICKTMHAVNHNRTRASELLGISIRTLRNKLKEYQTSHPDFQGEARP